MAVTESSLSHLASVTQVNLFWVIGQVPEFRVFNRVYRLRELVRERFVEFLRKEFVAECFQVPKAAKSTSFRDARPQLVPPSSLLRTFSLVSECLQLAASYVDVDVAKLLRETLYEEATACVQSPYVPGDPLSSLQSKAEDDSMAGIVGHYTTWYKSLVQHAAPGIAHVPVVSHALLTAMLFQTATGGTITSSFANIKKGFVGSGTENFATVAELEALYNLLGGYGFAVLESELMKIAQERVQSVKVRRRDPQCGLMVRCGSIWTETYWLLPAPTEFCDRIQFTTSGAEARPGPGSVLMGVHFCHGPRCESVVVQ